MSQLQFDLWGDNAEVIPFVTPKVTASKPVVKVVEDDSVKIANKLLEKSKFFFEKAEDVNTEINGNYTNKRARQAADRQNKKKSLHGLGLAFNKLATQWLDGSIPEFFKPIRSQADIEKIIYGSWTFMDSDDDSYDWVIAEKAKSTDFCKRMNITSKEQSDEMKALMQRYVIEDLSPYMLQKIKLENDIQRLRALDIQGFFPTPDKLIDLMIDYANIVDGEVVLEPSAGIGNIADRVMKLFPECSVECCEVNYTLSDILTRKEHKVIGGDIFELDKTKKYKVILMNPPFEKDQAITHTTYCFENFLKKGGRLVSVVPSGTMNKSSKVAKAFKELVEEHGYVVEYKEQFFKGSFNNTNITISLIVLSK